MPPKPPPAAAKPKAPPPVVKSSSAAKPPPPPPPSALTKDTGVEQDEDEDEDDEDWSSVDSEDDVPITILPDLNGTKSQCDEKMYRQILLPNGLRCVLVSDTRAMEQGDDDDDDYYEDDEEEEEEEEEEDDDGGDGDDGSAPQIRISACAMCVGVGSYFDPPDIQGLAHYLEHMLFMGTVSNPSENCYDEFMQKHGGGTNDFTANECTVYYFEVSKGKLAEGLERFGQFFYEPLLTADGSEREVQAVEAEFNLHKSDDSVRVEQLRSHTCRRYDPSSPAEPFHPAGGFSWGNVQSLQQEPQSKGIDVHKRMREFYDMYYYARNMCLVVLGGHDLDKLQKMVTKHFKQIPAEPRMQPTHPIPALPGTPFSTPPLPAVFGSPNTRASLATLYRIVPVRDRHSLHVLWFLPPELSSKSRAQYLCKPVDFLTHLIGHEGAGSLLSRLKQAGWVSSLVAGEDESCFSSTVSLGISLNEEGVAHYKEVLTIVYKYVALIRAFANSSTGFPPHLFVEMKTMGDLNYRYGEEPTPADFVESLAEDLNPVHSLPLERALDGSALLWEFDPDAPKKALEYFTPSNMRVELLSSTFTSNDPTTTNSFCSPPLTEPAFGTTYWTEPLSPDLISLLETTLQSEIVDESLDGMWLPPPNPYVPSTFELKPFPANDAIHPLLNASVKVASTKGKKQTFYPATVTRYDSDKHALTLTYEDGSVTAHRVDEDRATLKAQSIVGGVITFDSGKEKCKILGIARPGQQSAMMFGDETDLDVACNMAFPPIPPPLPPSQVPAVKYESSRVILHHLQDRIFLRPVAELRLKICWSPSACVGGAKHSPEMCVAADVLAALLSDSIAETVYLASICELQWTVVVTETGFFDMRFNGFDNKLQTLVKFVLSKFMAFKLVGDVFKIVTSSSSSSEPCSSSSSSSSSVDDSDEHLHLPDFVASGRFAIILEDLRRHYRNQGMSVSAFASEARLRLLLNEKLTPESKLEASVGLTPRRFKDLVSDMLGDVKIEALLIGNVDAKDATDAGAILNETIGGAQVAKQLSAQASKTPVRPPHFQHPPIERVGKVPLCVSSTPAPVLPLLAKNADDRNSTVEYYFQIGPDSPKLRAAVDLLAQIMDEKLFNILRTKEQIGYDVSASDRWTHGVVGFMIKIVTSTMTCQAVRERVDLFLETFGAELRKMSREDFLDNVVGLAKNKLEMFSGLGEYASNLWGEVLDRRFQWQSRRDDVVALKGLVLKDIVTLFDSCIKVGGKARRCVEIRAVGGLEERESLEKVGGGKVGRSRQDERGVGAVARDVRNGRRCVEERHRGERGGGSNYTNEE